MYIYDIYDILQSLMTIAGGMIMIMMMMVMLMLLLMMMMAAVMTMFVCTQL